MTNITLTVGNLIEVCEYMGVEITNLDRYSYDRLDEEVTIHHASKGILIFDEETGKEARYRLGATCDGCDYHEVQPIGEEM